MWVSVVGGEISPIVVTSVVSDDGIDEPMNPSACRHSCQCLMHSVCLLGTAPPPPTCSHLRRTPLNMIVVVVVGVDLLATPPT